MRRVVEACGGLCECVARLWKRVTCCESVRRVVKV